MKVLQSDRDVTARKRANEELREAEMEFRMIVEGVGEGLMVTDFSDRVIYINPHLTEMIGYTLEEMKGKPAYQFILPPEQWPEVIRRNGERQTGVTDKYELYVMRKDGSWFWMETHASPYQNSVGEIIGTIGAVTDITKRKRAQEELRESEERYRLLFESNPQPAWVYDLETLRFLTVNQAAISRYGYSREEFLAMTIRDIRPPEDIPRLLTSVAQIKTTEKSDVGQWRHVKKDGTIIDVDITALTLRFDGKRAEMILATDITERNRAEEVRRQLEEQLRQSQKMESIGTLAGGVAHDFNNLLTVITGNAQLIKKRLDTNDPIRQRLAEVEKAASRAATLTRQLLAFSRRQQLERKHININDTVADTMKMLQRLIGANIEVHMQASPNLPHVFADPAQIEQVVMNLAVNARDAMPSGGRLTIETHDVTLDENYCQTHVNARPGRYAQVVISDTGTGMDADTRGRIFEPFFTTKGVGKGTGLGLSMVYGIIAQHEGQIEVYSEVGRGTTFKIYLPVAEKPCADEEEIATPTLRGGKETILLAEDEDALRELVREVLESMGYTVLAAQDGEEALDIYKAERERIALLMLDVVMPRLGGQEAYEQMRAMGANVPLILMTGYCAESLHARSLKSPDIALVQKPYSVEALARRVREVLDETKAQRDKENALQRV